MLDDLAKRHCACKECIGQTPYNGGLDERCCYDSVHDAAEEALERAAQLFEGAEELKSLHESVNDARAAAMIRKFAARS